MVTNLLVPDRRIVVPKPPSYLKLDMAFAIGAGAKLMDKSRYRSHGDITGASWAAGLHGYALDFDRDIPSYVEIPASHTQLNFTSEDFSIVMRITVDSIGVNNWLFARGLSSKDGWELYNSSSGTPTFWTSQSGAYQITTGVYASLPAETISTLGLSRSGASALLYINGVEKTGVKGTHINPASSNRSLKVGIHDNKTSSPLDGKIEFLRIFGGVALSTSEHLAWHNALK